MPLFKRRDIKGTPISARTAEQLYACFIDVLNYQANMRRAIEIERQLAYWAAVRRDGGLDA